MIMWAVASLVSKGARTLHPWHSKKASTLTTGPGASWCFWLSTMRSPPYTVIICSVGGGLLPLLLLLLRADPSAHLAICIMCQRGLG